MLVSRIGAGLRFGKQLPREHFAGKYRREEAQLLLFGTDGQNRR